MAYQSEYELERRLNRDLIEYNRYQPIQVTDEKPWSPISGAS